MQIQYSILIRVAMTAVLMVGTACSSHFLNDVHSIAPYSHPILPVVNHFVEEENILEAKLKSDPKSFQTAASLAALYTAEAKLSGDQNRFDQAEVLARKSISLFPVYNDRAYLVLADVAQARHHFDQSNDLATQVLESSTSKRGAKIEALSLMITANLADGKLREAHRLADQLVNAEDTLASHVLRALVLEAEGRDAEVLFDYETAYQKESFGNVMESAKLRAFWGRSYFHQGEYHKARALFKEALRIVPGDALARGLLADLELSEGKFEAAEKDYEKAFAQAHQSIYLWGQVQAKKGLRKYAEANELRTQLEKLLRKSLSEGVGSGRYAHRNELVKILLDRGNFHDGEEALKLAQEEVSHRRNAETLFLTARAYAQVGEFDRAHEVMQEIFRTGVRLAEYSVFASKLEGKLHHLSRAQFYADEARRINPRFSQDHVFLKAEDRRVAFQ